VNVLSITTPSQGKFFVVLLISLGDDEVSGLNCEVTGLPVRPCAFHHLNVSINGNPSGIKQTLFGFCFVVIVDMSGVKKYTGSFHGSLLNLF
jgi:hypothetical protein